MLTDNFYFVKSDETSQRYKDLKITSSSLQFQPSLSSKNTLQATSHLTIFMRGMRIAGKIQRNNLPTRAMQAVFCV